MIEQYNRIYNVQDSPMKVDNSWDRYKNPVNSSADHMPQRYQYSIERLYGHVLDVGAGDGFGAHLMLQNPNITKVTCLEIQGKAIINMKKHLQGLNVEIIQGCIEEFEYPARFDSIHCGHTLEHVLDEQKALQTIQRLAKDLVVISVPINGGVNREHLREWKKIRPVRKLIEKYFRVQEVATFRKPSKVYSVVFITKV